MAINSFPRAHCALRSLPIFTSIIIFVCATGVDTGHQFLPERARWRDEIEMREMAFKESNARRTFFFSQILRIPPYVAVARCKRPAGGVRSKRVPKLGMSWLRRLDVAIGRGVLVARGETITTANVNQKGTHTFVAQLRCTPCECNGKERINIEFE